MLKHKNGEEHDLFSCTPFPVYIDQMKGKANTSVSRGKEQHKGKTLQLEKKKLHTAAAN